MNIKVIEYRHCSSTKRLERFNFFFLSQKQLLGNILTTKYILTHWMAYWRGQSPTPTEFRDLLYISKVKHDSLDVDGYVNSMEAENMIHQDFKIWRHLQRSGEKTTYCRRSSRWSCSTLRAGTGHDRPYTLNKIWVFDWFNGKTLCSLTNNQTWSTMEWPRVTRRCARRITPRVCTAQV